MTEFKIEVLSDSHPIGSLIHISHLDQYSFDYSEIWLSNPDRFALSPLLPLTPNDASREVHSANVRCYFQNLLPEGISIQDVAMFRKISKSNLFGLLLQFGQEPAGSLSIGLSHPESNTRLLSQDELSQRIKAHPGE